MIRAFRLCETSRERDVWSGAGGLYGDGRWHRRGRPVIYTASSVSLAQLEVLAHVSRQTAPAISLAVAEIPDSVSIARIEVKDLPPGWDSRPRSRKTADLGDRWLARGDTAVLCVPSVMSPESNYLLNPQHPEFRKIALGAPEPFMMDGRLFTE